MRYLLLLAVIPLLFVGCNKDDHVTSPPVFADTTISLKYHQTAAIPGTGLSLRLDTVLYDGRVPHDSAIPLWWTNTAQLQFTLLPSGAKMHLYISGEIADSPGVHFDAAPVLREGLSYRLAELTPLPTAILTPVPDTELLAKIAIRDTTARPKDSCVFPLALGNQWIYLDSAFSGDSLTAVTTDTVTITGEYTDQNGHWWVFSSWFFPYGRVTMGRADTLFSQQIGEGTPPPGQPLYFPWMEFAPPVGDSSRYWIIVEGDLISYRSVAQLHATLVTPAGSFEHGLKYSAMVTYVSATEVLVPGVGFVYMENIAEYDNGYPWHTNRMWLSKYSLK
jgi:hypothetical protein